MMRLSKAIFFFLFGACCLVFLVNFRALNAQLKSSDSIELPSSAQDPWENEASIRKIAEWPSSSGDGQAQSSAPKPPPPKAEREAGNPPPNICEEITKWATQDRLHNIDQGLEAFADPLMQIDDILGQTFCLKNGRFRTTSTHWNVSDVSLLEEWEFKLIYLSIHDLFHRPARDEYHTRKSCQSLFPANDYQCKDAKFLITNLLNSGLGASVRVGAIAHMLNAVAAGRIPLFISGSSQGPELVNEQWLLASCEHGDTTCVFQPTTPCTILKSELEGAVLLRGHNATELRRTGAIDDEMDHHRVLAIYTISQPMKGDERKQHHDLVRKRIHERAIKLIEEWEARSDGSHKEKVAFLKAAATQILESDNPPTATKFGYGHRFYRVAHALLLYWLRPNKWAKSVVANQIRDIFKVNVAPATSIGLPIRGSDKCKHESTCLGFNQYMQLAEDHWAQSNVNATKRGSIIMTTEDEEIFRQRHMYNASSGFPFDFIVNEKDLMQGTGNVKAFGDRADDVMTSSLVAMVMQLHAGQIYTNCCSNFHLILMDLVKSGCGLTEEATCLQETKDYNMCCAWSKDAECKAIRKDYDEKLAALSDLRRRKKRVQLLNNTEALRRN